MANTFINTLQVKNISIQLVPIFIKPKTGSPIFKKSGQIQLKPETVVEAEDDRFDISQIRQLQKLNLIDVQKNRRIVEATSSGTDFSA